MSTKPANDVQFKSIGDAITANDFNAVLRVAMYHPPCEPTEEVKPWYNAAATACPAYGVAAVTGTYGTEPDKIVQGDKPSSTMRKEYIVNTLEECDATSEGTYQNGEWVLAAYDTGTPALDETWVPKSGQWTLTKGTAGAPWGIVVAGIVDADAKILLGKIVESSETFQFHNSSGETIPAYAVMQVTGVDGTEPDVVPKVGKIVVGSYTSGIDRDYLVNTDSEVLAGERGTYQNRPVVKALYSSGTPAVGEYWRPLNGGWKLFNSQNNTGTWCILVSGIIDSTDKILEGSVLRPPIRWGVVQASPTITNQSGATTMAVSVISCDYENNRTTGSAFDVYTPISPRNFTDIDAGDIVGYMQDAEGDLVIVTDCWATAKAGKPWVSLDTSKKLIHLHPQSADIADEGDPTIEHFIDGSCGFYVDDCGHVLGYYACGTWMGPFGAPLVHVTVEQAEGQSDPTNDDTINFTVVFSRAVTDFDETAVSFFGAGSDTAVVTGTSPGTTFNVAISGMNAPGDVTVNIDANKVHDAKNVHNEESTSIDNSVTYDNVPPVPVISEPYNNAPTYDTTIVFTVMWSEPVYGFSSVTLSGSAGATSAVVEAVGTLHREYTVTVTGMTGDGLVKVQVPNGSAEDAAGNLNLVASAEDSVTWLAPEADKIVDATGCNPDVSGTYVKTALLNGKGYYVNGAYSIMWDDGASKWYIFNDGAGDFYFERNNASVLGSYTAMAGHSGSPTVSE